MLHLKENKLFMKNVVAGITSECFLKGVQVPKKGVEIVIKNLLLNPDLQFSYDAATRKEELSRLSDACLHILCGPDKGLRKLYDLQAIYHGTYHSDDHVMEEYESLKMMYIEPLLKKIVTTEPIEDEKISEVYRLMVTYTLLETGTGNPMVPAVFDECQDALGSIFSLSDLVKIFNSNMKEKKKMLIEVSSVTAGVLLYNKFKKRGGIGVENYPGILGDSLDSMAAIYLLHLQHAQESSLAATKLITDHIYWCQTKDDNETLVFKMPSKLNDEEFTHVFWMSLIQKQVISYMRRLFFNLRHYSEKMERWQEKFINCCQKVDEKVSSRIAVPAKIVYPLFIKLYNKWKVFYHGLVIVSVYQKLLSLISEFLQFDDTPENVYELLVEVDKKANLLDDLFNAQEKLGLSNEKFYLFLSKTPITHLREELATSQPYYYVDVPVEVIDSKMVKCKVMHLKKKEINKYELMFGGYDPVYLIESNGVVADVVIEIGVLVHDCRNFGFRDLKSAYKFGEEPDKWIGKVVDFVRRNPHYIDILQLRDFMDSFLGAEIFSSMKTVNKPVQEKIIQTEDHPIPSYIDDKYVHSIWQARTNLCLETSLTTKKTKSIQTLLSYMKTSIGNQTYQLKDDGMQTKKDGWANTQMPSIYHYGLRGQRDVEYSEVSLTLPLEEPYQAIIKPTPEPLSKEIGVQTSIDNYFDSCLKVKVEPHPPMYYIW